MSLMFGPTAVEAAMKATSYSSMNEWLHVPGKNPPPPRRPLINTVHQPYREVHKKVDLTDLEAVEEAYPDLPQPNGPEDKYKRIYNNLTNQIAYRYPNPGSPRHREGSIGGTWRHIREVLSHGGRRICFVDGLVSVYDNAKFTEKLQAQLPYRPHIKLLYAPNIGDVMRRAAPAESDRNYYRVLPGIGLPVAAADRDPNLERKIRLQEQYQTSRKGFYQFGKK